jgi:hypothetical protein
MSRHSHQPTSGSLNVLFMLPKMGDRRPPRIWPRAVQSVGQMHGGPSPGAPKANCDAVEAWWSVGSDRGGGAASQAGGAAGGGR